MTEMKPEKEPEKKVRWGIFGTGNMANQFANGLSELPSALLQGVGSRSADRAQAFAHRYGIPHAHASYEELAQDETIDIVYIATPHIYHHENSLLCLRNGKAILCEKPFTINREEAEEVFNLAKAQQKFAMEAVWTRFLPHMVQVIDLVQSGAIGTVGMVQANFGYRSGAEPESRIFNPDLAGGALLDVGIYPIYLAYWVLGMPEEIVAKAHLGQTGVDERAGIVLSYENGALAVLSTAIRNRLPDTAVISGSRGRIVLHERWWAPDGSFTLYVDSDNADSDDSDLEQGPDQGDAVPPKHVSPWVEGNGYNYEAQAAMDSLRQNALQNPLVSWEDTLNVQQILDTIRKQWGLVYPAETDSPP